MTRFFLAVAAAVALLSRVPPAPAQEPAKPQEPPKKQTEVVITATPLVESTQVSPYGDSAVRVGGEQIDLQNAQDLATALSRVPGITMTRHNVIGAFGGGLRLFVLDQPLEPDGILVAENKLSNRAKRQLDLVIVHIQANLTVGFSI